MRTVVSTKAWVLGALALVSLPLWGCEKKEESATSENTDKEPVPSAKPPLDSKLANAMEAASKDANNTAASAGNVAGNPQQNGVMSLTQADAEISRPNPSVLTLGSAGSPPLIQLGPGRLAPGKRYEGSLEVGLRTGPRSAMPTLVFQLEATSKDGGAPGQVATTFRIKRARLSDNQPGQLPEGLAPLVAKLQGSTFSASATDAGASAVTYKFGAPGSEDFEPLLSAAGDLLQSIVVPYPKQPVGVGAFWMVKSRELFHGSDTVAYRMMKVEEINGQQAKLSVATRRYAVGSTLATPGLPPHTVMQFESPGEGELMISAGAAFPEQGQLTDTFGGVIAPNGDTQHPTQMQAVMQGTLTSSKP